jgi:hypothetical protein
MAKRKTSKQRASEFFDKSCIKLIMKDYRSSENDFNSLEIFWRKWLNKNKSEPADCLYKTVFKLLKTHKTNLFERYTDLKNNRVGTLEHFKILYGDTEGTEIFNKKNLSLSKKLKIPKENLVTNFLNLKKIKNKSIKLTPTIRFELEELLYYIQQNKINLNDNAELIVDLIINYEPTVIERFKKIKLCTVFEEKYFKLRYANNWAEQKNNHEERLSSLAKKNFPNTTEYWLLRGLDENDAIKNSNLIQKDRARRSKEKLINKPTCRSIDFWLDRGHTVDEAKKKVYDIQCRDLNFFVAKYNEDDGLTKYNKMITKRLLIWNNQTELKRNQINKSKGRTYKQLVEEKGVDVANNIIKARTQYNNRSSKEANDFFKELDELIGSKSKLSITEYKCPEKNIIIDNNLFFLDYVIGNIVIEYNGSFWHADKRLFNETEWHPGTKKTVSEIWEQDKKKVDLLKKNQYNVLVIWSYDVACNRKKELLKCKDFINEHY